MPRIVFGGRRASLVGTSGSGISKLSVKARVMPSCFFVRCRHWLRVDGVLLRLHDTRLYHRFSAPAIVLERREAERPWAELGRPGERADPRQYRDPDSECVAEALRVVHSSTAKVMLAAPAGAESVPGASRVVGTAAAATVPCFWQNRAD